MTDSEKYVLTLCESSFLNLWCFPNPIGKKKKELCDILVVCGTHVLIFSVKEIEINPTGNFELDNSRWLKRAVDDSIKQIYGAERIIKTGISIVDSFSEETILLPELANCQIHRIAISLGRGNDYSLKFGDFGKGFVHVFDEATLDVIFNELSTITDFINYLNEKEYQVSQNNIPLLYSEKDLLAFYLLNGRSLEINGDENQDKTIIFENDIWDGLTQDEHYLELKKFQISSVYWDKILDEFLFTFDRDELIVPMKRNQLDKSIFYLALESRHNRVVLGQAIKEFINPKPGTFNTSRITHSPNNRKIIYVFLLRDASSSDRMLILDELQLRLYVAREILGEGDIAIGIGMDSENSAGYSYDLCTMDFSDWTKEDSKYSQQIQSQLGFYKQTK